MGAGSVDAVVVHYNRLDLTTRCIEALAQDEGPLRSVSIVDSGSTPPLGEPHVSDWARILKREHAPRLPIDLFVVSLADNVGFAEGNNRGLALRVDDGADFYLVLNNDAYVSPAALQWMVATAQESGAGMITPAVYRADAPDIVDRFGLTLTRSGAGYDRRNASDGPLLCPSGCAALYRRDVVLDLMSDPEGFFDRRFSAYAEDLDTGLRARARGYGVAFAAEARILHEGSATFGRSSERAHRLRHRNTIWAIAKNFSLGLLFRCGISLGLGQLAGIANAVRRGRLRATARGKLEGLAACWRFRRYGAQHPRLADVRMLDPRFWLPQGPDPG